MSLQRLFLMGIFALLAMPMGLCAQDGGPRDGGGRGNQQAAPNSAPQAQGDGKPAASSVSGSSGNAGSVSGFGVTKKHEIVSGFGAAKKTTAKKTTSGNASKDSKSAKKDEPDPNARLLDMVRQQAKSLLNQYDDNKNGKLERGEWSKMHRRHWIADQNRDGEITLDELTAHLSQLNNVRAPVVARADRRNDSMTSPSGSGTSSGSPYPIRTAMERLPEGLPDWFARKDADGDGQVAMAEYAVSWSEEKVREFRRFDLNNDGIITPKECLKAEGMK